MFVRNTRILRLSLLGAALFFLACVSWDEETLRTKDKRIQAVVDNALDHFASQLLSEDRLERPEDIFEIQSFLSCLAQRAEWRATMSGPKLVIPTASCSSVQNVSLISSPEEICQLLPGKRILLVGPETTHFIHSLWLDVVEGRRNRTHTCPGRAYCTFHHICRRSPVSPQDSDIHDRTERKKKMPSDNSLLETRSALLQYTYSTTLYAGWNQSDMLYQFPVVDLETGVQQVSQYWLRRARRADVIILSRAPIPAPMSTHTSGTSGNWTFVSALCGQQKEDYCRRSLPYSVAIAALDMTLRNFLPSVMETIRKLATDTSFQGSLRVWHGNWFIQPSCAVKGLPSDTQIFPAFWSCTEQVDSCYRMDAWSYFYNVQVYLHDRILSRVLPYYGVVYLPLTFPIFDQGLGFQNSSYRSEYAKDCIREPWSSFPEELSQVFLAGLSTLLTLRRN